MYSGLCFYSISFKGRFCFYHCFAFAQVSQKDCIFQFELFTKCLEFLLDWFLVLPPPPKKKNTKNYHYMLYTLQLEKQATAKMWTGFAACRQLKVMANQQQWYQMFYWMTRTKKCNRVAVFEQKQSSSKLRTFFYSCYNNNTRHYIYIYTFIYVHVYTYTLKNLLHLHFFELFWLYTLC